MILFRLRTIQSKLEIRVPSGPEWEELRRLDLTQHQLRMEGDLSIRNDSNKKINVLVTTTSSYTRYLTASLFQITYTA